MEQSGAARESAPRSRSARAAAHPVRGRRLPGAIPMARLASRMAPRGAGELAGLARTGSLEELRAAKRTLVVSFRRDGRPVPTPVWAAYAGGVFFVRSERSSGKAKRLRRDARVLIAPCSARGRPLGRAIEAHGFLVAGEQEPDAQRALAERYGLGRELFERAMDVLGIDMCYLRLEPGAWDEEPPPG